jgi:hypothetical protein
MNRWSCVIVPGLSAADSSHQPKFASRCIIRFGSIIIIVVCHFDRIPLTKRHDATLRLFASLAKEVGLVTVEPNSSATTLRWIQQVAATITAKRWFFLSSCSDKHWNRHGDLLLLRHDVVYRCITCTDQRIIIITISFISHGLHSAKTERPKKRKYAAIG